MKAGQLEIEILADVARLQKDLDRVKGAVNAASKDIARNVGAANDNIAKMGNTMGYVGRSSRALRANMLNLGRQASDVAQGFALGQAPMQIFLQQGFQISEVLATMSIEAKAAGGSLSRTLLPIVGRFLLKWSPLIAAISLAAGAFKLFMGETEKSAELDKFAASLGLTKDEMKELEGVGITAGDVFKGLYRTFDEYLGLTAIFNAVKDAAVSAFKFMLRAGTIAASGIWSAFVGTYDAVRELFRAIMQGDWSGVGERIVSGYRNRYNDAMGGFEQFGQDLSRNTTAAAQDRLRAQRDEIIGDRKDKRGSSKKAKKEVDEELKALEALLKASQDYAEGLADETAKIGLNAIEIKKLEMAQKAAAAETAAATAPTDALRDALLASAEAIRKNYEAWEKATRAQADSDFQKNVIEPLENELKLLGLVGPARDLAALALEEQALKAQWLAQGVTDVNAKWEEYLRLRTQIINGESALDKDLQTAELLREQLRGLIGDLGSFGGVGQGIGGLLGILTGNTSAVGGALGQILNAPTGKIIPEVDAKGVETGKLIGETIGDRLSEFFDKDSPLVKTLQAAGTGLMVGGIAGFGGAGGKLGSAIGGALGEKLGEKFLSKGLESIAKGLGDFAGPLGSIAGSLIGGALGSLLSSTPRGSATIGAVGGALGVTGTRGNSQARIAAATDSANAIIGGLEALAAELGATIDPSRGSVSIGIRKGSYRVDTSGAGRTKTSRGAIDFGEDAEAAALFAMQDLIRDGVLVGLRKGTENLLKNASDLEVGLQKALAFEGVFRELKAFQDPLGAALDSIEKEFDRLRKIFDEAGATAEEYAQLEELLVIKRQEAIDRESQRFIDDQRDRIDLEIQILQLLGREQEALTLARQTELASMKASLRPLQEMIYQLQDAQAIISQFGPLAQDLRAFKQELLGSNSRNSFAFIASRFRSTAAQAGQGDAAAMAQLRGVSTEFLEAARANASSKLEYDRAVGEVLSAVDSGIFAADAQIEYAQMQIDAINANSGILLGLQQDLRSTQERLIAQGEWVERIFRRWDGEGLRVQNDADTPIYVETVA